MGERGKEGGWEREREGMGMGERGREWGWEREREGMGMGEREGGIGWVDKHVTVSRNKGHYLFQYPHILSVGLETETVYPRVGNI